MVKRLHVIGPKGQTQVVSEVRELPHDGPVRENAGDVHRRQAPLLVRLNRS